MAHRIVVPKLSTFALAPVDEFAGLGLAATISTGLGGGDPITAIFGFGENSGGVSIGVDGLGLGLAGTAWQGGAR